jgi:hypothetical protein
VSELLESLLQSHGVVLAPGRAQKIRAALEPILAASGADAQRAQFELEPATYLAVVEAAKWKR